MNSSDKICAIVVHHKNLEEIFKTVQALISDGIKPSNIIVVDNSEDEKISEQLSTKLNSEVVKLFTNNKGFGNAANSGIDFLKARVNRDCEYLLILTHESQVSPGTVGLLQESIIASEFNCAAGPIIKIKVNDCEYVFSAGGHISRFSLIPRHYLHMEPLNLIKKRLISSAVEWLDQTLILYRYDVIKNWRFDESFFMYSEELELHLRMKEQGWKFVLNPDTLVQGFTNGVPSSIQFRQQRILRLRIARTTSERFISFLYLMRPILSVIKKVGILKGFAIFLTSIREKMPPPCNNVSPAHFVLINPLGKSLFHYVSTLSSHIKMEGLACNVLSIDEPSLNSISKIGWILNYIKLYYTARKLRSTSIRYIVVWPFFGHFERVIAQLFLKGKAEIVFHDPIPMTKNWGYSNFARRIGRHFGSSVKIIVHSAEAREILITQGVGVSFTTPHPLLPNRRNPPNSHTKSRKVVRVLGQYKEDRDVSIMKILANGFSEIYKFEVIGSGWHTIPGWELTNEFVPESQMQGLIDSSDLILIPYRNFFQSGIAIRAIESGIPILAPQRSSLAMLVGRESQMLVNNFSNSEEWIAKMRYQLENGNTNELDLEEIFLRVHTQICEFIGGVKH